MDSEWLCECPGCSAEFTTNTDFIRHFCSGHIQDDNSDEPKLYSEYKPDPYSEYKPDPYSEYKPDPYSEYKPDPYSEYKPDPYSEYAAFYRANMDQGVDVPKTKNAYVDAPEDGGEANEAEHAALKQLAGHVRRRWACFQYLSNGVGLFWFVDQKVKELESKFAKRFEPDGFGVPESDFPARLQSHSGID